MTSPRQNPTAPGIITLDLAGDEPGNSPPTRLAGLRRGGTGTGREVRAPLWACVLVAVVGSLVIGVGVHYWDASQVRRLQGLTVSLLLNVPSGGSLSGTGDGKSIALKGDVQVVNTGPRAIRLGRIGSSSPGVTITKDAGGLVVPAGAARLVNLSLTVTCGLQSGSEPLRLLLDVRTFSGGRRDSVAALNIAGTSWNDAVSNGCPSR
jgi:hypothetical protein